MTQIRYWLVCGPQSLWNIWYTFLATSFRIFLLFSFSRLYMEQRLLGETAHDRSVVVHYNSHMYIIVLTLLSHFTAPCQSVFKCPYTRPPGWPGPALHCVHFQPHTCTRPCSPREPRWWRVNWSTHRVSVLWCSCRFLRCSLHQGRSRRCSQLSPSLKTSKG